MGTHNEIIQFIERGVFGRFFAEYVKPSGCNGMVFECPHKRSFINQLAAGSVDEHTFRLHSRQRSRIYKIPCLLRQGQMQADKIADRKNLIRLGKAYAMRIGIGFIPLKVVGQHLHMKTGCALCHAFSDGPQPEYAELLAIDIESHAFRPVPLMTTTIDKR